MVIEGETHARALAAVPRKALLAGLAGMAAAIVEIAALADVLVRAAGRIDGL